MTAKVIPFPRHEDDCIEGRLAVTLNAIRKRDRDAFIARMHEAQKRGDTLEAATWLAMAIRMSVT